ncbi:MAG: cytochrome P450 [Polyangia bacterium]
MTSLPAGPRGFLWVNFESLRDPLGAAARWRRKYGDPMTYPPLAGRPLLVTGTPSGIRALFSAAPSTLEPILADRFRAVFGDASVFVLSGEPHTAMRKLLLPPFHGQRMRDYGHKLRELTLQAAAALMPGSRLVAQDLMHAISLQAIIRLVFGITDPARIAAATERISAFRRALGGAILPILLPFLRREFLGLGPWARMQRATRAMRELIDEELARSRAAPAGRTDILSLLAAARPEDDNDDGTGLSDAAIFEQMLALLLAGHGSTAMALTWALYFLGHEPQVLERLQAELRGLGPDPEPEALQRAPLLDAVCSETLRLRPAVTMTGRQLRAPLAIDGYTLPAGAGVFASIVWAHTNPEVFPQPERFVPERFLEHTYSPFEYLPFGGGNRRCIGAAFALYEMKIALGTLLRRFRFELVSQKPVRVVQRELLVPDGPIRLIAHAAP